MAIYTQYARYLKAKEFKKLIDSQGDTYMLLGFGNPLWDSTVSSGDNKMPVAPFNTDIVQEEGQFKDGKVRQKYLYKDAEGNCHIIDGYVSSTDMSDYNEYVKDFVPLFPCYWDTGSNIYAIQNGQGGYEGTQISTGDLYNFCVSVDEGIPKMHYFSNGGETNKYDSNIASADEPMPLGDSAEAATHRQVYAELYLRGLAVTAGLKHPVGLLGAVKCSVEFVKDIGTSPESYTGSSNQIWYGDRYWEIINDPLEGSNIHNLNDPSDPNVEISPVSLPTHILFNATINPTVLCSDLNIDQYITPRQIAIFTREREVDQSGNKIAGPNYYRAYENVFNFGQYTYDEMHNSSWPFGFPNGDDVHDHPQGPDLGDGAKGAVLNFTLPVQTNTDNVTQKYPDGEFKFLLTDYIKGNQRSEHSIDRIGYIVGF